MLSEFSALLRLLSGSQGMLREHATSKAVRTTQVVSSKRYADSEIVKVRGEESFYADLETPNEGELGFRCNESADQLLPKVVDNLRLVLTSDAGNKPISVLKGSR